MQVECIRIISITRELNNTLYKLTGPTENDSYIYIKYSDCDSKYYLQRRPLREYMYIQSFAVTALLMLLKVMLKNRTLQLINVLQT